MILSETTVQWRGATLSGARGATLAITSLSGWDDWSAEGGGERRPQGHGRFDSAVWSDERVITLGGRILSADRDALLATLGREMTPSDGASPETLTITHAGVTLTADARVTRYRPDVTAGHWGVGHVPFAIEWRCADPLRYGSLVNAATAFPSLTGGLEFDLFTDGTADTGWLEFGAQGSTGRVVVSNPGTADTWPQFQVTGPAPAFTIACVESGRRLSMPRALSAGEVLLMDSATGIVMLNGGDVDYSGLLTRAEWFPVARESSCTIALLADGPLVDSHEALTVIMRPAWW